MVLPNSTVILAISTYSQVDPSLFNYNLDIRIERYLNETRSSIQEKYNFTNYYYSGIRYKFYQDYLESHPEVEYVMFCDDDTLILKNPFELLKKNENEVHFMFDVFPFSHHQDHNYIWLVSWIQLNNNIKQKCGINKIKYSLNSSEINNQIPWNSGLMMGKRENLIPICRLMAYSFICSGMFKDNNEQGLLNYLYLSGNINQLGIKFHGHTINNGSFLSCPSLLSLNSFRKKIKFGEAYVIHHYQFLRGIYRKVFDVKFREKIDLQL